MGYDENKDSGEKFDSDVAKPESSTRHYPPGPREPIPFAATIPPKPLGEKPFVPELVPTPPPPKRNFFQRWVDSFSSK